MRLQRESYWNWWALGISVALFAGLAGCSAGGQSVVSVEPTVSSSAPVSSSTGVRAEPLTSSTTTATEAVSDTTMPVPAEGDWARPVHVGSLPAKRVVGVLADRAQVVYLEGTGAIVEGCEGEPFELVRLMVGDPSSGERTVLIDELKMTDQTIVLGPQGRLAIGGGCDANAWLEAVGAISDSGELELRRTTAEPGDRLWAGNNAGYSVNWSQDGTVLYFNTARVDAATGVRVDDGFQRMVVHAEIGDGSRLVSDFELQGPETDFWLIGPEVGLDGLPEHAPLFSGRATYPAANVQMSPDGNWISIGLNLWEEDVTTYVVGGGELIEVGGNASAFSPNGEFLLIEREGERGLVLDLASGVTTVLPAVPEGLEYHQLMWCCGGEGLVVAGRPNADGHNVDVWLIEATADG